MEYILYYYTLLSNIKCIIFVIINCAQFTLLNILYNIFRICRLFESFYITYCRIHEIYLNILSIIALFTKRHQTILSRRKKVEENKSKVIDTGPRKKIEREMILFFYKTKVESVFLYIFMYDK